MKTYKTYRFKTHQAPIMAEINWRVHDAMKSGVTIRELHEATGIAVSTWYKWLNGTTRCANGETLAAALGAFGATLVVRGGKALVKEDA